MYTYRTNVQIETNVAGTQDLSTWMVNAFSTRMFPGKNAMVQCKLELKGLYCPSYLFNSRILCKRKLEEARMNIITPLGKNNFTPKIIKILGDFSDLLP